MTRIFLDCLLIKTLRLKVGEPIIRNKLKTFNLTKTHYNSKSDSESTRHILSQANPDKNKTTNFLVN